MIGSAVSEPPEFGDLHDLVAREIRQVVLEGVFLVLRADVDRAYADGTTFVVDAPVVGDVVGRRRPAGTIT